VTNLLFPKKPKADLPVQLSGDIIVTFRNKVPGSDPAEYIDWPVDTTVQLVVGKGVSQVIADADITGSYAKCRIESEIADGFKDGTTWACRVTVAGVVTDDNTVALNGKLVRDDGA
jgi:hypothetical protein